MLMNRLELAGDRGAAWPVGAGGQGVLCCASLCASPACGVAAAHGCSLVSLMLSGAASFHLAGFGFFLFCL